MAVDDDACDVSAVSYIVDTDDALVGATDVAVSEVVNDGGSTGGNGCCVSSLRLPYEPCKLS